MKNFTSMNKKRSKNPYAHLQQKRRTMLDEQEAPNDTDGLDGDDKRPAVDDDDNEDNPEVPSNSDQDSPSEPVHAVDEDPDEKDLDDEDAKADEDDDDVMASADEDEADDRADAAAREKDRCAAIFRRKAAALNPSMAAHLAFHTNLSRKEAVGLLEASVSGMSRREKRSAKKQGFTPNSEVSALRSRQRTEAIQAAKPEGKRSSGKPRLDGLLVAASKIGALASR